jgi:nicotinate phosphoribosyltransferase
MWEMPILSTISELMHLINGDLEKIDLATVFAEAYGKGIKAIENGIVLSEFGTRRRTSFDVQHTVMEGLMKAQNNIKGDGAIVGTSNVWFAKEFNTKIIGTMSHQLCSFEECVSGVFECNHQLMQKWSDVYDGDLGVYLPDCFGSKVFLDNFSKKMAKMFDGVRIDSGDEREETERMIAKYLSLGVDPKTKSITYSNALTIDKAIELHKWLGGRMKDSYGIGTHLTADVKNKETGEKFPYSNIVIKLTGMRITELREWLDCVKLSNDKGKTLGNKEKCDYLVKQIG